MTKQIALIAAVSENGVIGRNNDLPWKIRDDMRLFMAMTTGQAVIMGRKSFESMGCKPLPNRLNIILSRDENYSPDVAAFNLGMPPSLIQQAPLVGTDIESALALVPEEMNAFIIGGAQIYKAALPYCTHFFRSTVHENVEGDTFFPEEKSTATSPWAVTYSATYPKSQDNEHSFTFEALKRIYKNNEYSKKS